MKELNIFILFFLMLIKHSYSDDSQDNKYLVLNFKTNVNLKELYELEEKDFLAKIFEQNIYVDVNVGQPPQTIPMTLKIGEFPTFIFSSEIEDSRIQIKYDKDKSKTYQLLNNELITGLSKYDCSKGYYSNDTFSSSTMNSFFCFLLGTDQGPGVLSKNISGEIGLARINEGKDTQYLLYPPKTQFLKQLHEKSLIEQKMFGLVYDTEYEGRLIFGKYLHQIDNNYKEEEIITSLIEDPGTINNWNIDFEVKCQNREDNPKIYYQNSSNGDLLFETGFIIGTESFRVNFAKNYFKSKECYNITSNKEFYYCDNEEKFADFPDIIFSVNGQYSFNFTKDDLFKKVGDKYYFLIAFEILFGKEITSWRMGQPFFRKYAVFLNDLEKRFEMSYYLNKKLPYKSKDDNSGLGTQAVVIIVLSCVVGILIVAIVVYFVYFYPKNRKKRAQELNDDYDYNAKEEPKDRLVDDGGLN